MPPRLSAPAGHLQGPRITAPGRFAKNQKGYEKRNPASRVVSIVILFLSPIYHPFCVCVFFLLDLHVLVKFPHQIMCFLGEFLTSKCVWWVNVPPQNMCSLRGVYPPKTYMVLEAFTHPTISFFLVRQLNFGNRVLGHFTLGPWCSLENTLSNIANEFPILV